MSPSLTLEPLGGLFGAAVATGTGDSDGIAGAGVGGSPLDGSDEVENIRRDSGSRRPAVPAEHPIMDCSPVVVSGSVRRGSSFSVGESRVPSAEPSPVAMPVSAAAVPCAKESASEPAYDSQAHMTDVPRPTACRSLRSDKSRVRGDSGGEPDAVPACRSAIQSEEDRRALYVSGRSAHSIPRIAGGSDVFSYSEGKESPSLGLVPAVGITGPGAPSSCLGSVGVDRSSPVGDVPGVSDDGMAVDVFGDNAVLMPVAAVDACVGSALHPY
jgi:hypothetical protein